MSDDKQSGIAPHHWVGLCLITESRLPHEWPYIVWVIRNRVESGKYRHTYEAVVLQPSQFSAFNKWTTSATKADPLSIFRFMARGYHWIERLFQANDIARDIIAMDRSHEPFPITVRHYYSPISMKPLGSKPAWEKTAKRLFTPEGVDPQRFVFADGVLP